MKIIICFICAVITTSALAANPQIQYSGVTYGVEVVRDNGSVINECITFHKGGRFTMSGETLTMLWAPQVNFSDQFMAVTAPGERTVVPHHQGVYGAVLPDKTLKGHGIDQDGSTFEFHGQANDNCYANRSAQTERNANPSLGNLVRLPDPCLLTANDSGAACHPIPDPLRALVADLGNLIRFDPCLLTADDSGAACSPIAEPLLSDANNVTQSTLAGRSFRLTLGTSDKTVLEYCWTFGEKHQIEAANGDVLTWSPNIGPNYNTGFRSAGAGKNGRGMAFHGALVGDELLEVVGIEARDGESVVTYGFGQQVATCQ